ncbi:MAG: hypothetical protein ACON5B_06365 [Myxococcota bacterium]
MTTRHCRARRGSIGMEHVMLLSALLSLSVIAAVSVAREAMGMNAGL